MKRVLLYLSLSGLVAGASMAGPQSPRPPAAGTGRIAGVVVAADSMAQPVRRAIVRLASSDDPNRSVVSDDQGRFVFEALPAGRFTLTVSKPAWVTTSFGARAPGEVGTDIALAVDETIAGIRVPLTRGAAISGTVRDRAGAPIPGVRVRALPVAPGVSVDISSPIDDIVTDDRGAYRAYGLAPGDYVIAATSRVLGLGPVEMLGVERVDAALNDLRQRAAGSTAPASTAAGHSAAMAPIFFPATPVIAEAERITLEAGQERDGVDLIVSPTLTAAIEGIVHNPFGVTPTLSMKLGQAGPRVPTIDLIGIMPSLDVTPGPDEPFRFSNVIPGTYTIVAQSTSTVPTTPAAGEQYLWATVDVTVDGRDISGIRMALRPDVTVSGRVTFEAHTRTAPDPTQARMTMRPPANSTSHSLIVLTNETFPSSSSTLAKPDGTFELIKLLPSTYQLTATMPGSAGPGWRLKSAMAGGRDLADAPFELGDARLSNVILTFSDLHTSLTGLFQTPAGQPATDYVVLAFPADATRWLPGSRRLQRVRPASDGRFTFADLPPGDYILAAVTRARDGEWQTPAFLSQLMPSGVRVSLGEGEHKEQNLKISGG